MLKRREFLKAVPRRPVASDGYWMHVHRQAMACRFEVTMSAGERGGVGAACTALDEVERLEAQLTIFRESSEVSFINRRAAAEPVKIDASLFALLRQCVDLYHETGGAFDITSGPLSRCWGFLRREGRIPNDDEISQARAVVGGEKLLLDRESGSIGFAREGVEINLGSIGKGYALDRAAGLMRGRVGSALLGAGSSSLLAIGGGDNKQSGRQKGFLVGIRHPRDRGRRLAVARLRDTALSTSGGEEQFFEYEGRRYGHIIDPRTGVPADRVSSATVIANSAALTDALATAFYVGGPELAEQYCATHREVFVLMLESGAERPVIFGSHSQCEVDLLNE